MNYKSLFWIALVVAVFAAGFVIGSVTKKVPVISPFGGAVHNITESFDEGIDVDQEMVITGEGRFIERGETYAFGESASRSLAATDICGKYAVLTIDPDGSGDDVGASLSFPDDEALVAIDDCLDTKGSEISFYIDNISSTATAYLDIVTTGLVIGYATTQQSDWNGEDLIKVTVFNVNGTSLSWEIDTIYASVSFQD